MKKTAFIFLFFLVVVFDFRVGTLRFAHPAFLLCCVGTLRFAHPTVFCRVARLLTWGRFALPALPIASTAPAGDVGL